MSLLTYEYGADNDKWSNSEYWWLCVFEKLCDLCPRCPAKTGAFLNWCVPHQCIWTVGLCLQLNKALHFMPILNHLSEVCWTLCAHKFSACSKTLLHQSLFRCKVFLSDSFISIQVWPSDKSMCLQNRLQRSDHTDLREKPHYSEKITISWLCHIKTWHGNSPLMQMFWECNNQFFHYLREIHQYSDHWSVINGKLGLGV